MTEAPSHSPARTTVFGDLEIDHDDRVLEPRPWTALQSRWAAELLEQTTGARILELCAGAGHIGLLAASLSGASLVCVDLNPVACDFARSNAERAGLLDRVEVHCVSLEQTHDAVATPFDLVIADPPWVPREDIGRFPEDPELAIDGGHDGLDVARACLRHARDAVAPGAAILLQLGTSSQAETLTHEATELGWRAGELRQGERGVVQMLVAW